MKISNLRIERHEGFSYLTVDFEVKYTKANKLWFSVPSEYEDWLTCDVYDAFLVAALYPAMYYNEDVEIDGEVSHRLYYNCTRYVKSIIGYFRDGMSDVDIKVKGFRNAEKKYHRVGTGFSAGIDSFATFYDHFERETDPDYKIDSLFFFNVGSHGGGGEKARRKFLERYNYLKSFPDEVGLPYIPMDSNLFDFYQNHWEFDAGEFCRCAGILVFERALDKYFLSSDYSYKETMFFHFNRATTSFSELAETFTNPLLSTEVCEIISDGGQYMRTDKTLLLKDYEPAHRYLNVCVGIQESACNCGRCHKCIRTLVALDTLGILDRFSKVFDIEEYKRKSYWHKCNLRYYYNTSAYIKDNVDFAAANGRPFPPYIIAATYMTFVRIGWQFDKIKRLLRRNKNVE